MNSRLPPIPEENRSPKDIGDKAKVDPTDREARGAEANPDKIGQQGNSKVNTTHQGYQQDR
ncbi:hypothetical protein FE840_000990 [Peteryoungia desertarenae]|uniref:Uncharacterized protein n=1 Tax=Peteryoungia desertarenae TaxID=1813451 RepID=A0ABX6QI90_9HYPH|nr:hypothetical protein [Peteryoungia desertarenae]QLF68240.1 hypothetical protein FE840_000990 [Peteryoungia desertarenae]